MELKPIPSQPGYLAGDDGNIYSTLISHRWNKTGEPRKLSPGRQTNGYWLVTLKQGERKYVSQRVHSLVCEAFYGPRPEGMEASHKDDDKNNNRPENLAWETKLDNHKRRVMNGIDDAGHRNSRASLTKKQVEEIRILLAWGWKHEKIAKLFGVGRTTITRINTGERYPR